MAAECMKPPESINKTHGDEGSGNDISPEQQTNARGQNVPRGKGQELSGSNIINAFVLKEEIEAHSLIINALAGHVQQDNVSHFVSEASTRDTCHQTTSLQNLSGEHSQKNYLPNHDNVDETSQLAFRVSHEGGVQLIAVQHAVDDDSGIKKNKNNVDKTGFPNSAYETASVASVEQLIHYRQHEQGDEQGDEKPKLVNLDNVAYQNLNIGGTVKAPHSHSKEVGGDGESDVPITLSSHTTGNKKLLVNNDALMSEKQCQQNQIVSNCPARLFVANSADEAHDIIKSYAEETMSTFVSMRKMKQFGVMEGGIDLEKKKYRVFFESCDVQFDGIPYVYVADKMYICHLGKDKTEVTRQKIRQQSMERRLRMGLSIKDCSATRLRTKKIDCPVKITVKMIAKFPQYQVLRKTKRVCETASKKVRAALLETNGQLRCYYLFVGKLPAVTDHNHPVGEETAVNEPIDPLIKDKIIELTWEGVQSSNDVRKHLDEYVAQELFSGKTPPVKTRRRYYPNVKDIRNYMNKAKMLTRLSLDVRNELQMLGIKFQTSHSGENIIIQSDFVDDTQEALLQIKSCEDEDDGYLKPTLIFCHQTSQQQRLIKRYGNQFTLCEVTNLMQRGPFPLFCLFVQTNVDYQVVASFVVELRNKESVMQGLGTVKEWNPSWSPKYTIVDYSEEQMEAVKAVFPNSTIFISDISRERNWRQWLAKADSEIRGNSEVVFEQFQGIANSYNEEDLHAAALQLENSEIWAEAATLRSWFNSNWLLEAKKWVVGYRPDDFFEARHNEMGIEADLNVLRDTHIAFTRSRKLSAFIEHFVDVIIPDFYKRYVDLNRKSYNQANELKTLYGDQLPACLVNKPAAIILYVLNQMKSTESTVFQVSHVQPGVFWIQEASTSSSTAKAYTVSFGDAVTLPSCDCLDWQHFKLPCKHLCTVFTSFTDWGWDMLNSTYTSHPIINIDYSCIQPWLNTENEEDETDGKTLPEYTNYDSSTETEQRLTTSPGVNDNNGNTKQDDSEPHGNQVFVLNVSANDLSSLGTLTEDRRNEIASTEDRRNEIAIQCHNLLQNLSQLSSSNLTRDESFERLKCDLQASLGLLKTEAEKTLCDEELTADEEPLDGNSCFDDSKVRSVCRRKRGSNAEKYAAKKQKCLQVENGLIINNSVISTGDGLGAFNANDESVEEETVETEIVTEADNNALSRHSPYEYLATKGPAGRRIDTLDLTPEQRERQLLAILTANTD